jgi:hypothetical protein
MSLNVCGRHIASVDSKCPRHVEPQRSRTFIGVAITVGFGATTPYTIAKLFGRKIRREILVDGFIAVRFFGGKGVRPVTLIGD